MITNFLLMISRISSQLAHGSCDKMLISILMCETFEISIQDNSRCLAFSRLCSIEIFWKWSEVYPSEVISGDFVQ